MDNYLYDTEFSQKLQVLLIILGLMVLLGAVVWLARFVNDFSGELRAINMEIRRTEGRERRYWLRTRRRLWLSLLPFYKY